MDNVEAGWNGGAGRKIEDSLNCNEEFPNLVFHLFIAYFEPS